MGWKYTPAFPDTLSHYDHLSTKIDGRHFFMLTLQLLVGIDEVEPSRIQADIPFLQKDIKVEKIVNGFFL